MFKKRYIAIAAGIVSVLLVTLLFNNVILAQTGGSKHDPWLDYNEDGIIDANDLYSFSQGYGALGDPTKNVNVTNFPLDEEGNLKVTVKDGMNWLVAADHVTAILNQIGGYTPATVLSTSNEVAGIGGKNITFVSGGISGGASWTAYDANYGTYFAGGETPGAGMVEVYNSTNNLLAQFALPLNSMFTVQNVDKITVYARAPIPHLMHSYYTSHSVYVVASVYWIED